MLRPVSKFRPFLIREIFGIETLILQPTAIDSVEVFGATRVVQVIGTQTIASEEAFGSLKINQDVIPSSIATEETFGTAKINLQVNPSAIASLEEFGIPEVSEVFVIGVIGIPSQESFGVAQLKQQIVASGILSEEAFGILKIPVLPVGIQSGEIVSNPRVIKLALQLPPIWVYEHMKSKVSPLAEGNFKYEGIEVINTTPIAEFGLGEGPLGEIPLGEGIDEGPFEYEKVT